MKKLLVRGSILAICSMISFGSTANAMNAKHIVGALKHSIKRTLQQANVARANSFEQGIDFVRNGYTFKGLGVSPVPEHIARFHKDLAKTTIQMARTSSYLVKCDPVTLNKVVKLAKENAKTTTGNLEEDAANKAVRDFVKTIGDDRLRMKWSD